MARQKKEKIPELYQILDKDGSPVRIRLGLSSAIDKSRVGKIYQSKAAALTTIRKAIKSRNKESATRFEYGTVLFINHKKVTDDEWQEELLKLKIRIFQPTTVEDVTFHLDKIK